MNRADFTPDEFQRGVDHLRTSMVEGLAKLPAGANGGSFMIGAFCALVTVIWNTREPGASVIQVQTVLATTLTDVVRQCEAEEVGEYQIQDSPVDDLLQAFRAAAICVSPLDSQGGSIADGDTVLQALALYAGGLLASIDRADQRALRRRMLTAQIDGAVADHMPTGCRKPFAGQLIKGGQG